MSCFRLTRAVRFVLATAAVTAPVLLAAVGATSTEDPLALGAAQSAATPRAADPRQTIIDWYLSADVAASEAYLLKSTRDQLQAFRAKATTESQRLVARVLESVTAPGPMFAQTGQRVSTKGKPPATILVQGGPYGTEITLLQEVVQGDMAVVPVTVKYGDNPVRQGRFELKREAGLWRVVMVDLGDDMHLPRLDGANVVPELTAFITKAIEANQAAGARAQVVANLNTLVASQSAFAQIHGGLFAPIACLSQPKGCTTVLGDATLPGPRNVPGYTGTFHAGASASPAEVRAVRGLAHGLKSWAYVVIPEAANSTARSYCADSTSRVCSVPSGKPVAVLGGRCPAICEDLKQ